MISRLYVNAKVFTGRGEDDFAAAFRITDGFFSWVGDQSDVTGEPAIDLGGRTVVPGFLDVHTHPAFLSTLTDAVRCLPPAVNSLAELLETLRTHPNAGQGPDAWIQGFGYDESKYPEGRGPTADELDLVSTSQPVYVRHPTGPRGPRPASSMAVRQRVDAHPLRMKQQRSALPRAQSR